MKKEVSVWRKSPGEERNRDVRGDSKAGAGASGPSPGTTGGQFAPACDIEETESEYRLSLDLPGLEKEEIAIEIIGGNLYLAGERRREATSQNATPHRRERHHGRFERTFHLPSTVDTDHVTAEYGDGVLSIAIPKGPSPNFRTVEVSDSKSAVDEAA